MSQSASQAAAFYRGVAANRRVWTVKDDAGFPAPLTPGGGRTQPFWSSLSRVEHIIRTVEAYAGFRPHELTWEEFRDRWIPGLAKEGIAIGVNWSGPRATGYDVAPESVKQAVDYEISQLPTG